MPTRAIYPWEKILNPKRRILLKRGADFRDDLFIHSFLAQIYQNHRRLTKSGKLKSKITVHVVDNDTVSIEPKKEKDE